MDNKGITSSLRPCSLVAEQPSAGCAATARTGTPRTRGLVHRCVVGCVCYLSRGAIAQPGRRELELHR